MVCAQFPAEDRGEGAAVDAADKCCRRRRIARAERRQGRLRACEQSTNPLH